MSCSTWWKSAAWTPVSTPWPGNFMNWAPPRPAQRFFFERSFKIRFRNKAGKSKGWPVFPEIDRPVCLLQKNCREIRPRRSGAARKALHSNAFGESGNSGYYSVRANCTEKTILFLVLLRTYPLSVERAENGGPAGFPDPDRPGPNWPDLARTGARAPRCCRQCAGRAPAIRAGTRHSLPVSSAKEAPAESPSPKGRADALLCRSESDGRDARAALRAHFGR